MTQNMGMIDRAIRGLVAVVVVGLYFSGMITGTVAIVLGIVGLVMLGTCLVGSCPLYIPLKISTKGKE
jgi:hypothetical protein